MPSFTSQIKNMLKVLVYILIVVAAVVGEVKCIYKFLTSDFEPSYKRECVYGFSALLGVGAVVGYFDIPDTPKAPVQPELTQIK